MDACHPEILPLWETYLVAIRSVRAGDVERYETAYEAALDDAAISGDPRAERLTTALADFVASAEPRTQHYDRVESLASAAIQSHNALLEAEGLILLDPTAPGGGRSGIGAGASGRDADAQLLLDQVIAILSATLDGDGLGAGSSANVREWVWNGFLGAVTN